MKIKGTAIRSISKFVQSKFPDRYQEWFDSLPKESQSIYADAILSTRWYPLNEAAIIPTTQVGRIFYSNTKKGAWETGRYSASSALTGIYKVFVKLSSPTFVIERACKIFSAYYDEAEIEATDKKKNSVVIRILKFDPPSAVIEYRIAGWMEVALELSGCKNVKIVIPRSLSRGAKTTDFVISWDR